jgi:tetratricopeptide (TPR) repeat protein
MVDASQEPSDVFISYSSDDVAQAAALEEVLQRRGMSVWRDKRRLKPGQHVDDAIPFALRDARAVVVIWSGSSMRSDWVKHEASYAAIENKLACLFIEPFQFRMLPSTYRDYHADPLTETLADPRKLIERLSEIAHTPRGRRRIDISRLPSPFGSELFGREREMEQLLAAWDSAKTPAQKTNIVVLDAMGGTGKTALIHGFLQQMAATGWRGAQSAFAWSFYSQGMDARRHVSADEFFRVALQFYGHKGDIPDTPHERGTLLAELLANRRALLILDGLEPLQSAAYGAGQLGDIRDRGLRLLVKRLATESSGLCIITTRIEIPDLRVVQRPKIVRLFLRNLEERAGVAILRAGGVQGSDAQLAEAVSEYQGHAFALTLLGNYLRVACGGDVSRRAEIPGLMADEHFGGHARRIFRRYESSFEEEAERSGPPKLGHPAGRQLAILYALGLFDRPAERHAVLAILSSPEIPKFTEGAAGVTDPVWRFAEETLSKLGLLVCRRVEDPSLGSHEQIDAHPLVREYFGEKLQKSQGEAWAAAHQRLHHFYGRLAQQLPPGSPLWVVALEHALQHGGYINELRLPMLSDASLFRRIPVSPGKLRLFEIYSQGQAKNELEAARAAAQLQLLQVISLFDRPADSDELSAVFAAPPITHLTDKVVELPPVQMEALVDRLCELGLMSRVGDELDVPPVVKTYFSEKLRSDHRDAFQMAHKRLYNFLRWRGLPTEYRSELAYAALAFVASFPQAKAALLAAVEARSWPESWNDVLPANLRNAAWPALQNELRVLRSPEFGAVLQAFQPNDEPHMTEMFAAIRHGCAAGDPESAWSEVYLPRVRRNDEDYAGTKLGLHGAELSALAHFFEEPWSRPDPKLSPSRQALLLSIAGFRLRALGRTRDALGAMRGDRDLALQQHDYVGATHGGINFSELLMITGEGAAAKSAAALAVEHADRTEDSLVRLRARATLANALFHGGELMAAAEHFAEAERLQAEAQPQMPLLYGLQGFEYCELLLEKGLAQQVIARVEQMQRWTDPQGDLLSRGLNALSLGRAHLHLACLPGEVPAPGNLHVVREQFDMASEVMRRASNLDFLVPCLLGRARLERIEGDFERAHSLEEAMEITERSGLKVYLIDGLLESARTLRLVHNPVLLPEARQVVSRVDLLMRETGFFRRAPDLDIVRAYVAQLEGDKQAAVRHLGNAAALIEREGAWVYLADLSAAYDAIDAAAMSHHLRAMLMLADEPADVTLMPPAEGPARQVNLAPAPPPEIRYPAQDAPLPPLRESRSSRGFHLDDGAKRPAPREKAASGVFGRIAGLWKNKDHKG